MSADYHRPTLTFPTGAYNATQVRLYGIVQAGYVLGPTDPRKTKSADGKIVTKIALSDLDPRSESAVAEVKKLRKEKVTEEEIYRQIVENDTPYERYSPVGYSASIVIDTKKAGRYVEIYAVGWSKADPISCGIIVGYSYEGHCYDLPKPKIMLIPDTPRMIPIDDCGYRLKYDQYASDKYMLWIVDKLDECVEFEMNQGFVEQLVLEANLPGKRSPAMYASKAMMGHRGGKLND